MAVLVRCELLQTRVVKIDLVHSPSGYLRLLASGAVTVAPWLLASGYLRLLASGRLKVIRYYTDYKLPVGGPPDPVAALKHLLKTCFVGDLYMFESQYSPFHLLLAGRLVVDIAFVRAVVAASKWLGPDGLPGGYISLWPPPPN